jgi:protein-L-isoaspartate(D-aspartate) O-methyltransferase
MASDPGATPGTQGGADLARAKLVDELRDSGRLASEAVEAAFRAVPRHVFLPDLGAAQAYQDEAFVIKTDEDGLPVSSSSQPAIMAIMLEQLGIAAGQRVLEIGTGTGYNAALMSYLVGPRGSVVSVDIDADLVEKARANLVAAGYPGVLLHCGDGGFGAPDYAPYDRIIVTAGAWDLAPQWLVQLGAAGRIVLPLSVRGVQLCLALERGDGLLYSRSACRCGFIRMAGTFASPEPVAPLGPQPGWHVQADAGGPADLAALYAALTGPATDVAAGVQVAGLGELGEADLWVTITEPGLERLTITGGGPACGGPACGSPVRGGPAPGGPARGGSLGGGSLPMVPLGALAGSAGLPGPRWDGDFGVAALLPARELMTAAEYHYGEFEVVARGFGTQGAALAERLAVRAAAWQDAGRPRASGLSVTAYPPGAVVPPRPGQVILDRRHTRLALSWPPPLPR